MSDKPQDRDEASANHAETPHSPASVDRRGHERRQGDRRKRNIPVAFDRRGGGERRQAGERRRQIDPTTCERDYSEEEIEFMRAMDRYKRDNRRPFPTWSEVLEVLFALGYRKVAEPTALPGIQPSSPPQA
jgi:hypothetical protein